jgi:RNA polymerase sigma factor (sigma-70 family)
VPEQPAWGLPEPAVADGTPQVDQRSDLIAALRQLPPRQRAVVVLRYWDGLTETQAAEVLGCSVGNVKSQASRALAKLRTSALLRDGSVTW